MTNDLEKSYFLREVRQKSCVGRVDEGAQHEETVQNKKDPKDLVQEDKDDVIKVSRSLVLGSELGSGCRNNL